RFPDLRRERGHGRRSQAAKVRAPVQSGGPGKLCGVARRGNPRGPRAWVPERRSDAGLW
ncbi:hypothetical protein P7K49_007267, partial [Saguinus oedipus]